MASANRLALKIHTNFVSGSITADNIAIYLHGFGYDHTLCDIYPAAPCPDDNLVTRFFTDEDALLGMDEDDFLDRPLPNRVNEDARTFRHPFLRNATKQGPLRVWAEAFMDALDAKITQIRTNPQHNPYRPDLPHPSVYRWYFDTESWFALPGNRNGVFMLRYIAEQSGQGSVPDIWNTWKVPGSEGWDPPLTFPGTQGQTLAQMYAEGVAAYGWPANILEPVTGILQFERADHERNRPIIVWWYSVLWRAQDAIMKNCAYDVIKAKWPTARCGNYDTARYDGLVDTTGWFVDFGATTPGGPYPSSLIGDELPRVWIDRLASVHLYGRTNVVGVEHDRWIGVRQHASGDVNSPFLYPLTPTQLDGYPGAGQHGHRQPNLYLPATAQGFETDVASSSRLDRHAVESIINSHGGGHDASLVPWLAQFVSGASDPVYDYYTKERPLRVLVSMLRGKNVPEMIFWTGTNEYATQHYAWQTTEDLVKRVYMARVVELIPISGNVPAGFDLDPMRLEYTLLDTTGQPREAGVDQNSSFFNGTVLEARIHFDTLPTQYDYTLEVNLEARADLGGGATPGMFTGQVLAWHVGLGWVPLPTIEDGALSYGFHTPDATTRRTFKIVNRANFIQNSELRIRLVHVASPLSNVIVRSRNDLLQVIPVYILSNPICCDPPPYEDSDLDLSGESTPDDISLFLNAYAEGEPLADLTMDGVVDAEDVQAFLDAYTNASP